MLFTDLLRLTVLLLAGEATALAAVSVIAAQRAGDDTILAVAAAWWVIAAAAGLALGRPGNARGDEATARLLRSARTATALPDEEPGRIALSRLWPLGAFALGAGSLAWVWPQVAAVGAGYALLWSLAWRTREAAVLAVEDRDGVRFYVQPGSALRPIRLVRTPGLRRDPLERDRVPG